MTETVNRGAFGKGLNAAGVLLRIGRDILSAIDAEGLCSRVVETLSETCRLREVRLYLYDDMQPSYVLKASAGGESHVRESPALYFGDPLVQSLLETSHALVQGDLETATRRAEPSAGERAHRGRGVWVPVRGRQGLIGMLNLALKQGRRITERDLEFFSALADYIAIGIGNVRGRESLKVSQKIVRQAHRLASLGQLTAGLAHEIRNPLVVIRTFAQLFPERYDDAEFRETFQTVALKEVDRISNLVNDLLNFARPSVPKTAHEDANEIVVGVVRLLENQAKEAGVPIQCVLSSELPKIFVDKDQMKQVCINVLLNALQSIEGEGRVEVHTRPFVRSDSELFVQIEIRDTGAGIPEANMKNIFQPFFTTKKDGSGLGLSISHQIVEEQGGFMSVKSKVGEGTTFLIHLAAKRQGAKGPAELA